MDGRVNAAVIEASNTETVTKLGLVGFPTLVVQPSITPCSDMLDGMVGDLRGVCVCVCVCVL